MILYSEWSLYETLRLAYTESTHRILCRNCSLESRRDYWLTGNTIAYSFEVAMQVELIKVQDRYFPANIQYDGTWKIVTKKRESAKFTISFSDFKL